jgi:glutathione S-transferase
VARAGSIYHLTPESELQAGAHDGMYRPLRLSEDGFVHCSGSSELALAVAADYFADLAEPLYVLEIDPERLSHELRFEPAAPLEGVGHGHLAQATEFPHVYGPIDLTAITGAGRLARRGAAREWPEVLLPLDYWLSREAGA